MTDSELDIHQFARVYASFRLRHPIMPRITDVITALIICYVRAHFHLPITRMLSGEATATLPIRCQVPHG